MRLAKKSVKRHQARAHHKSHRHMKAQKGGNKYEIPDDATAYDIIMGEDINVKQMLEDPEKDDELVFILPGNKYSIVNRGDLENLIADSDNNVYPCAKTGSSMLGVGSDDICTCLLFNMSKAGITTYTALTINGNLKNMITNTTDRVFSVNSFEPQIYVRGMAGQNTVLQRDTLVSASHCQPDMETELYYIACASVPEPYSEEDLKNIRSQDCYIPKPDRSEGSSGAPSPAPLEDNAEGSNGSPAPAEEDNLSPIAASGSDEEGAMQGGKKRKGGKKHVRRTHKKKAKRHAKRKSAKKAKRHSRK